MEAQFSEHPDPSIMTSRNLKQVQNIKSKINKDAAPEDDLALVEIEAIVHPELVPDKRRFKGKLYVVSRLPEVDDHIAKLLASKVQLVFGYDTTFQCGDFYVSIFVFRHPFIKDHPVIPAGFLFHETKELVGHKMLFEEKVKRIPKLNSKLVTIVTDREDSIKNAIRTCLPKANYLFCYFHFKQNVIQWCISNKIGAVDKANYIKAIFDILRSNDEQECDRKFELHKLKWSKSFVLYYRKHLHLDIKSSCKGIAERCGVYDSEGVYNNCNESCNAQYKHLLSHSKKPLIEALMISYSLQIEKMQSLKDSLKRNDGDFKVKPECRSKLESMNLPEMKDAISLIGLKNIFEKGKFTTEASKSFVPRLSSLKSQNGFAELFVKRNKVTVVNGQFFVEGFREEMFHVNKTNFRCTCPVPGCSHSQAVQKIIGQNLDTNRKKVIPQKLNVTRVNKVFRNRNVGMKSHKHKSIPRRVRISSRIMRIAAEMRKKRMELIKDELADAKQNTLNKSCFAKTYADCSASKGLQYPCAQQNQLSGDDLSIHQGFTESMDLLNQSQNIADQDNRTPDKYSLASGCYVLTMTNSSEVANVLHWQFKDEFKSVPVATANNYEATFMQYENIAVLLRDVKSLQCHMSDDEKNFLTDNVAKFHFNYVNDTIIDAFLAVITKHSSTKYISCVQSTRLFDKGYDDVVLTGLRRNKALTTSCSILMPVNENGNHWTLYHVKCENQTAQITVFDSLRSEAARTWYGLAGVARIKNCISKLKSCHPKWEPTVFAEVLQQPNLSSCGAFMCYNALQLIHEYVLRPQTVSDLSLRNFVMHVIKSASTMVV